ncbi:polyprenol monophosphomannose synthase [Candidatus Curtissbacteria bacterium]|nr:polyprenol monophosphomannose synthase [Candidatus Curtissbacteria bacterium]
MSGATSKKDKIAIVIPTYNESENILSLIKAVKKNISTGDIIVIVDDNSPDKTGKIVEKFSKKTKGIYVIHRKGKNGRGSAVLAGFKYAKKFKPTLYIEMDADFSHKPEDIKRLVKKINEGFDVVIGSRYRKSSKIENWPPQRKIFSRMANLFAKIILNVPISDYTNGFRIYTEKASNFLLNQELFSKGYILLSETAYKLNNSNFSFGEIAIVFVNRKRGQSNTNLSEIQNAFFGVIKIRLAGRSPKN